MQKIFEKIKSIPPMHVIFIFLAILSTCGIFKAYFYQESIGLDNATLLTQYWSSVISSIALVWLVFGYWMQAKTLRLQQEEISRQNEIRNRDKINQITTDLWNQIFVVWNILHENKNRKPENFSIADKSLIKKFQVNVLHSEKGIDAHVSQIRGGVNQFKIEFNIERERFLSLHNELKIIDPINPLAYNQDILLIVEKLNSVPSFDIPL